MATRLTCTGCDRPYTKRASEERLKEIRADVHATPLGEYPFDHLTAAQRKSLDRQGITTIGGLADLGAERLLELPGFGPATVEGLRERTRDIIDEVMEHYSVKLSDKA